MSGLALCPAAAFDQFRSQAAESAPDPRLDCAQRLPQRARHLRMGETFFIGQTQDRALRQIEFAERRAGSAEQVPDERHHFHRRAWNSRSRCCVSKGLGADAAAVESAAHTAKANCPVSKLLNCEITLDVHVV